MARRTGQVNRNGENKWTVRIYNGTDINGKRRYINHTVRGTKKDAEQWLRAALRRRDLGEPIEESRESFNAHLDTWLKVKKQTVKARTLEIYEHLAERMLRPTLGNKRLASINAADIQDLYSSLAEQGYGGRTLELLHVVLVNVFRYAMKWDLLRRNPMPAVDKPRHVKKEMKAMTAEQSRTFLAALAGNPDECLLSFLLLTGCRPGEAMALKWSDIDYETKTVTIQRHLSRLKTGWKFTDPKTVKSRRTLPLPASLLQLLQRHRRAQQEQRLRMGAAWQKHDLVFPNPLGDPLNENAIRRRFEAVLTSAGLPHFRVYDLRHSTATLLMSQGLSPKIVSERLGHANINITLGVYSHVLPTMQQEATDRLEKLLLG